MNEYKQGNNPSFLFQFLKISRQFQQYILHLLAYR